MSALINARTASPDARRRWVVSRIRAMYRPYGIGCLTEARIASELGIRKRELMHEPVHLAGGNHSRRHGVGARGHLQWKREEVSCRYSIWKQCRPKTMRTGTKTCSLSMSSSRPGSSTSMQAGRCPTVEMESFIIFVVVSGSVTVYRNNEPTTLRRNQVFITEPALLSMRSEGSAKLMGIQIRAD